jgi:hypothetical protein
MVLPTGDNPLVLVSITLVEGGGLGVVGYTGVG